MEEKKDILIIRFLQNNCSKGETEQLLNWIADNDNNKLYFEQAEAIWNSTELIGNSDNVSSENSWVELNKRIEGKKSGKMYVVKEKTRNVNILSILKFAAIILTSMGITWFSVSSYYGSSLKESKRMLSVSVEKGSKSKVVLADGTIIWLNSETTIRYPEKFSEINREVYVEGEAYFNVVKDKNRPFKVKTSDMEIIVLGTSFNVKSYPNEGTIETTLTEGTLRIEKKLKSGEKQVVSMKPNQRVTLIREKGKIMLDNISQHGNVIDEEVAAGNVEIDLVQSGEPRKEKIYINNIIDPEVFTAWKDNKLVFKGESFRSIALKMERWYDVKIIVENKEIGNYKFTGTFENETIEQALMALQLTTSFKCKFDKNIIVIK